MSTGSVPLSQVDIPGLTKVRSGKVREIFALGDRLLLVATDRISAFDVVLDDPIPSKGAVLSLTRSLAVQFGPHGVRANAICPGPIETPLMTSWLLTDPEAKALRLNRIPMGRFGRPEDVVYLALYLASDESSWTNGAALVVDGGITSNYF